VAGEYRTLLGSGAFFDERVDGRSTRSHRFKEVLTAYIEELGRPANPTELNLLRSAASLQLTLDDMEMARIKGDRSNYADYSNALLQRDKMLRRVGILTSADTRVTTGVDDGE